jgi:hypothetical protein
MTEESKRVIELYLSAYKAANPNNTPPNLIYEKGWYRIYDGRFIYSSKRAKDILAMTERLKKRVAPEQ